MDRSSVSRPNAPSVEQRLETWNMRTQNAERREIKKIDLRLKQKEENRNARLGGGYFEYNQPKQPDNKEEAEQQNPDQAGTSGSNTKINNTPIRSREPSPNNGEDTSNVSSMQDKEPPTTKEPGSYPAIKVHEYRDGPIEEIAVHYVRINKIVENKQPRIRTQEDNVRTAELDFMLDLETLIKETSADPAW